MSLTATIKTPIIRVIANFYGCLGVQLLDIQLQRRTSLLNATLNGLLFSLTIYALVFNDPWNSKETVARMRPTRPLMAQLYHYCMRVIHPLANALYFAYLNLMGRRIVAALDVSCFSNVIDECKTKPVFAMVVIVQIVYSSVQNRHILKLILTSFSLELAVNALANSLVGITNLLGLLILHYNQHVNWKIFAQINTDLPRVRPENVSSQIRQMANANRRIQSLLSFPLFVYMCFMVLSVTAAICTCLAFTEIYGQMHLLKLLKYTLFSGTLSTYILYLVYLNHLSLQLFDSICTTLCFTEKKQLPGCCSTSTTPFKYCQLNLYRCYFELHIFRISTLNLSLIFSSALLIFHYVVFFYQTY